MKEFLTELRERFNGSTWAGPIVKADSLDDANDMMEASPYRVIGELMFTVDGGDDIHRFVSRDGKLLVH